MQYKLVFSFVFLKRNAVRNSVSVLWKVVDIWAQQPIKLHTSLTCSWGTVLIGWDCLWLCPSHYVCFPGLWSSTKGFLSALIGQLEDREEQQKVHEFRITNYAFKSFTLDTAMSCSTVTLEAFLTFTLQWKGRCFSKRMWETDQLCEWSNLSNPTSLWNTD